MANSETYLSLIRQWGGEDAVQGNVVSLDPRELDALSQWIIFDAVLPGQSRRIIEIYAQESIEQLPSYERALLTAELMTGHRFTRLLRCLLTGRAARENQPALYETFLPERI